MSPPSIIKVSEIYVDPPYILQKFLRPPLKTLDLVCTPPKKAENEAYPPKKDGLPPSVCFSDTFPYQRFA